MKSKNAINTNTKRTRNWIFILYPESAPRNWKDIISDLHIQYVISPLHDKDKNPDGEIKKAHHHILLIFDSVKSYNQILEITELLNAPAPQICNSPKGTVRYMLHIDNPEKYQYSRKDILFGGGVDLNELLKPSSSDRYTMIGEMIEFVEDNMILEFEDIMIYAMYQKSDTWFPLLCDNSAVVITNFINSKRYRFKDGFVYENHKIVNVQTGEVVQDNSHLFEFEDD